MHAAGLVFWSVVWGGRRRGAPGSGDRKTTRDLDLAHVRYSEDYVREYRAMVGRPGNTTMMIVRYGNFSSVKRFHVKALTRSLDSIGANRLGPSLPSKE